MSLSVSADDVDQSADLEEEAKANPLTGSRSMRIGDAAALLIFGAYAAAIIRGIWLGAAIPASSFGLAAAAITILGGYVLADLVSGVVHWLGDTFGTETTPIVGTRFIAPFREHHVVPKAMVEHGILELIGNTAIVSIPVLAAIHHLADPATGGTLRLALCTLVLATSIGTLLTNLFHRWAHVDEPPRLVAALQRSHLILQPEHHARHHAQPFNRYYCITTGWVDHAIERIDLFRRIERLLA